MSLSPAHLGVPLEQWYAQQPEPGTRLEIVGGELVVSKVGGNPHHFIAQQLARTFMARWPSAWAVAPGQWVLETAAPGVGKLARIPDVLVNGPEVVSEEGLTRTPLVAVEIWSPGKTLGEMETKRREYRTHGLPVLVEGHLSDDDVHLEWKSNDGDVWNLVSVADGETPLHVLERTDVHPAFSVVPNDLLRR